jgi:VCBS repeat-containing protein
MFKRFVVSGTKKNDDLKGTDRMDILLGKKGDDVLFGGDGNDFLFGGKGNDKLFGGDGWDFLFGGKGNDLLDGGAGNDYVFGGKGDDTFNFTLSENAGAKDHYDGGKGFDTLQLTLTSAEADAAEAEIEAFKAFLADGGKDFHFESFGLTVRDFEDISIELAGGGNTAPVAAADEFPAGEDAPIEGNILANDTDVEDGTPARVSAVNDQAGNVGAMITLSSGALLTVNQDGTFTYDPNGGFENLGVGDFAEDSFTYVAQDSQGANSDNAAEVKIVIAGVNDAPVAVDDQVTALAELAAPDPIRVAVLGREDDPNTVPNEGTTHLAAAGQLDAKKFDAHTITFAADTDWVAALTGFNVVVIGDSGYFDYGDETTTGLFSALSSFVDGGGGVVTTGWFARALPLITDPTVLGFADAITPITSAPNHDYAGINGPDPDVISVLANHEIVDGPSSFQLSTKFGWELAGKLDDPRTGATLLATGVASNPDRGQVGTELPAIAYDDAVGMGRTAYLGGFYLSSTDFNPTQAHTDPVLDEIFERAVAWAAGGGDAPTAIARISPADLLANDTDVDVSDVLAIDRDAFPMTSANGAALSFDDNGDIVYTPTAAGLQQLLAGQSITDSFNYSVTDGNGGFSDVAAVNLTVDTLL